MMRDAIDRATPRGQLLRVAERAIERASPETRQSLLGDLVKVPDSLASELHSVLEETERFEAAALRREYFESFHVSWRNSSDLSRGTDAFIAEFDRLIRRCLAEAEATPSAVLECLELLFDVLRKIDADPDRILFFADEAGSWQITVAWDGVLPVYFRLLAAAR
jgi:hypothetical protein